MEQLTILRGLFKFHSGRVIALGRVMLAITLFLIAMVGHSQSDLTLKPIPSSSFTRLARSSLLRRPGRTGGSTRACDLTHGIDMAVFTASPFDSTGTSSPFILFFILPLFSAAVRWSWRETAQTAAVLIVLFMIGGFLLSGSQGLISSASSFAPPTCSS